MPIFPEVLDNFTPKTDGDDDVMAVDVNELQTAIEALETKIGIDGSVDTDSLDYRVANRLNLDQTTPQSIINGIPLLVANISDFVSGNQLVNKEYVDQAISFINTFYFNNTASSIGGIYYKMLESQSGEAESSFSNAGLDTGDDQALVNFATDSGIPGVITLKEGVYHAHIHAAVTAGKKPVKIYFKIYTRTSGGTETLQATSEISDYITTKADVDLHVAINNDVDILSTDRIIIKWFANVEATGTNATVVLYAESTTSASLSIPTTSEVLSSIFVRQDGTKQLTADWDAGAHSITAANLSGNNTGDQTLDDLRPILSGTFASGSTTYQKTDASVTADSIIDVYAQAEPIGAWSVESYAGYFIITSTETETSNVAFKYFINN